MKNKKEIVETEEKVENLFENWSFLDQSKPDSIIKDDELTEEEEQALEDSLKKKPEITKPKEEKQEVISEEEEESEEEPKEEVKEDASIIEEDTEESPYLAYAKHMSSKGLLDLEEEDAIETEEDLEKVQERTISNRTTQWKSQFPEDVQKFLEFVENGGNPQDFHKYYYNDVSFENFSIEDNVENQKHVIRESLALEGYSEEEIEDEINLYEDGGKLESRARTHLNKLTKIEAEQKKELVKAQKDFAEQQEKARIKEWEEFKKGLFDRNEIGGFKLTPKTKDELWNYMTKVTDRKTNKTQYQIDSEANEDARYVFAYLLKNKWDIKSLERLVESKVTSKLHNKLSNFSDTRNKISKSPKSDIQKAPEKNAFKEFAKIL